MSDHADGPRVLILRDYHAENLIWMPGRRALRRVGLLDFQMGQMGQPVYDLVSLLQDARRDVSPETQTAMLERFADRTYSQLTDLKTAFAVVGVQRALRILGVFARLCMVAGKPGYLPLVPRVWAQLQQNLQHPAVGEFASICGRLLPEPTDQNLQRIAAQCGKYPMP